MVKAGVIGVVVALIVLIVIFLFVFNGPGVEEEVVVVGPEETDSDAQDVIPEEEDENIETEENEPNQEAPAEEIVEITSSGFSPKTLTINVGDKVTWINKGSANSWPASNNHPTHTIYSEFDSLGGISTGEQYGFIFERVGTWNYHDHLSSSKRGTVVVN